MELQELELDVAVVGGGVSGGYSAWRLQQTYGDTQNMALFEYSDRIGGRLFSITLPGMPNVVADVGGEACQTAGTTARQATGAHEPAADGYRFRRRRFISSARLTLAARAGSKAH